jgi:hypothetical protein
MYRLLKLKLTMEILNILEEDWVRPLIAEKKRLCWYTHSGFDLRGFRFLEEEFYEKNGRPSDYLYVCTDIMSNPNAELDKWKDYENEFLININSIREVKLQEGISSRVARFPVVDPVSRDWPSAYWMKLRMASEQEKELEIDVLYLIMDSFYFLVDVVLGLGQKVDTLIHSKRPLSHPLSL